MCVKQLAHHRCRVKVEAVRDTEVHSMVPLNPPSLPGGCSRAVWGAGAGCHMHTHFVGGEQAPSPAPPGAYRAVWEAGVGLLPGIWVPRSTLPLQGQNTEHAVIHFSLPVGASNKKIFMENVPRTQTVSGGGRWGREQSPGVQSSK